VGTDITRKGDKEGQEKELCGFWVYTLISDLEAAGVMGKSSTKKASSRSKMAFRHGSEEGMAAWHGKQL
jgi:hypothetical protein